MVGILVSFWEGLFSGAMLVLGSVALILWVKLHHRSCRDAAPTDSMENPPFSCIWWCLRHHNQQVHRNMNHLFFKETTSYLGARKNQLGPSNLGV